MKKYILITFLLISTCFAASSCKKCSQCVAKDKTTHSQVNSSDEFCGSKKDITAKEDDYKAAWSTIYDVECSNK